MKYVPKELERTADISRGRESRAETLRQAVLAVAALAVLYVALGLLADFIALRIPSSWEAVLARTPISSVGEVSDDARLTDILDRLLAAGELRELPYQLRVVDMSAPNAFAFPGGLIGVTRGLLDDVESEQGLAMVLGHELGHHHQRHVLKRLGRVLLIVAPVMALSQQAGSVIADVLELGERRYSREQEREADAIGLQLVYDAYGNTDGALEFFELVLDEGGGGRWSGLSASHPPTAERIEALRQQARQLERIGG